jgi:hypothetical protein
MPSPSSLPLDHTAIGVSIACAAHCLVLPAASAAAPVLTSFAHSEWVHWAMLFVAAPVAILALARKGSRPASWWLAGLGIGALLLGVLEIPDHDWEIPLTVCGGLLLAVAHWINLRARSQAAHDHPSHA